MYTLYFCVIPETVGSHSDVSRNSVSRLCDQVVDTLAVDFGTFQVEASARRQVTMPELSRGRPHPQFIQASVEAAAQSGERSALFRIYCSLSIDLIIRATLSQLLSASLNKP
jgi:hypothetical protein